MRVLIIESDADFAREASEALRERGVEATVVEDGQEGMDAARKARPDALILSVELGDRPQAGFSVCNRIKKDDALKEIPLLLVSAHATEETFEQHRKLRTRADAYLRKPFALAPFVESMEGMIPGVFDTEDVGASAGRTERFGWTGFDAAGSEEGEDEPLVAEDPEDEDEILDLDNLWGESSAVAAVAPAPAPRVLETPPALAEEELPPAPPSVESGLDPQGADAAISLAEFEATERELETAKAEQGATRRELETTRAEHDATRRALEAAKAEQEATRRALEATKAEHDATRRALDAAKAELDAARREAAEARERLASAESRLRESLAAREEAERKVEELRRVAQGAGALQERLEEMKQTLSAKESEALRLRQRLEQIDQVRQRAQKALKVAGELLKTIE